MPTSGRQVMTIVRSKPFRPRAVAYGRVPSRRSALEIPIFAHRAGHRLLDARVNLAMRGEEALRRTRIKGERVYLGPAVNIAH